MKKLLGDVWIDLREKRLWPVAAVLLLGLVAVPVVLSKPTAESPPAPAPEAVRGAPDPAEALTAVELEQPTEGEGSSLDTFDPANPFRPPPDVVARTQHDAGEIDLSGSGSESIETIGGLETGGGEEPSGGGDGGSPPAAPEQPRPEPEQEQPTTRFQYVVDVSFSANGRERKVAGMRRLDLLPSEEQPFLLFLGVESGGDNAVFLVDSTLQAAGEGSCRPSPEDCAFVHLGAGSEHAFTNDAGDSYTLRIDEIRIVKAAAAKPSRRARAGASSRRFMAPDLTDLVEHP